MPTTDTFIIPPMQPADEPKKEKKAKKSSSGKLALLIGLILLIITLPVGIFYVTQQQQLADTRSRAGAKSEACTKGTSACQIDSKTGKNSGFACKCTDTAGGYVWSCGIPDTGKCPVEVATKEIVVGELPNVRAVADGTAGGCGYIQKPPLSGLKPCNEETCGGSCGVFTGDCGNLCFDKACAAAGCASGGGVGAVEEQVAAEEPTATPEPTTEPTAEPNSSVCDASCSNDTNCASGLTCSSVDGINRCRNASCPAESTCTCTDATNTPMPTTETEPETAANTGDSATGQDMPVSGVGPGIIGSITVFGSVLLLLIGLAL